MAVVLMPDPPLAGWMEQLDAQLARSPKFFDGRAVMLDLSALAGQEAGFPALVQDLAARGIRVIGMEGVNEARLGGQLATLPPILGGGRHVALVGEPEKAPEPRAPESTALLIDRPIRSGQSVSFPGGDVTVVGSVASGAEVIAGGSIHVYGTLRGRAIAGLLSPGPGGARPRIFCRRLEAELLAIDGMYKTADEMDPALQGRPVQAWLDGDDLALTALD